MTELFRESTSQINPVLRSVVESSFADVVWHDELGCRPLVDDKVGDLSSSAALAVAKHRRVDVNQVGEMFLARLRAELPGEWCLENGYIVVSHAPLASVRAEADAWRSVRAASRTGESKRSVTIGVADDTSLPLYLRIRIAGLAALQGWIAATYSEDSSVWIGREAEVSGVDKSRCGEIVRCYASWLEGAVISGDDLQRSPLCLGRPSLESSQGEEFLWMSRATYERLTTEERLHIRQKRDRGAYCVRVPADGWLVSRERTLAEVLSARALTGVVGQVTSEDEWLKWLFHVASATPSSDFDPYVALVNESSSLLWNLRALADRFHTLLPGNEPCSTATVGPHIDPPISLGSSVEWMERERFPWRRLIMHGEWIGYWLERAVKQGDMESFVVVLEQFCRWGHRFLNAPQTRLWLATGAEDSLYSMIAASLKNGLRDLQE